VSGIAPSGGASARSAVNGSHRLRWAGLLARALHILLLAVLGGAAAGGGCLVTDPVPYEPAENIPPIIVTSPSPDPDPLIVRRVINFGEDAETEVQFKFKVREYNLDDVLLARILVNESPVNSGLIDEFQIRPTGTGDRDREVLYSIPTSRLGSGGSNCSKVIFAISDRGWYPGLPFYKAPEDADGNPLTEVALIQWWVWVKTSDTPDGPPVTACGGR
jgi:hypothetical protein